MNPQSRAPRITSHPDGVYAVDAEYIRHGAAAVHLVIQKGRGAFIDTGTNHSVPYLLAALEKLGLAPGDVDYVFLTHVHLDHAGGAGLLMRALPNASAVVHPRGTSHMSDPAKLVAASRSVYGEERFQSLYGEVVPIPSERIVTAVDGYRCSLADREFELIHTPGHAVHHYVVVDAAHKAIFAGDTFGVSYRELDTAEGAFIAPATTPPQFDPGQLSDSIDRIMSYTPQSIYLMHYSRVTGLPRLAALLKAQIGEFVQIAERAAGAADPAAAIRAAMLALWLDLLRRQGSRLPAEEVTALLGLDLDLNAGGLLAWMERRRKASAV